CFELLREVGALKVLLPPVHAYLEKGGLEEAERHLRALAALDTHVRIGEVPSDAVLLATLLAPLPRAQKPGGPIPKAPQPDKPAEAVAAPQPPAEETELDEVEEDEGAEGDDDAAEGDEEGGEGDEPAEAEDEL